MMSAPRYCLRTGFTMIEIAVVLIVLGAMLAVLLRPLVSSMKQEHELDARASVKALKDGVIGYVMVSGDLPLASALNEVAATRDPWGNQMAYFAPSGLNSHEDVCAMDMAGVESIDYTVDDGGDVEHVAFLVASPGPDREWGESGNQNMYAPGGPVELGDKLDDIVEYVTVLELKGIACD